MRTTPGRASITRSHGTRLIRNNTLRNNNTASGQGKSCWHGGQINLNNSQNVTISGNTIEAVATNGICMVNSTRHEGAAFPQFLRNIRVEGNIVKLRGPVTTGMTGDTTPSGVVFLTNTYYVDNLSGTYWQYLNQMTKGQWQAAGQDVGGKFLSW